LSSNPFIVNGSLELKLFKKKNGVIQLQAFDIFNQANNFTRTITDNAITDSKTNYITRYLKLKFALKLGKFGTK